MTVQTIAPVRKQVTVEVGSERAFEVFTKEMASWWKPGHHIAENPFTDIVIEPVVGGRWVEVDADGRECSWGRVLAWEPPERLVLAWQIDGTWSYDEGLVTEVEVRFVAEGPSTTRVELEHRHLERLGELAQPTREAFDDPDGWAGLLALFAGATG
jgi:uncharacterized protein YndB with AHSA1/START domain